MIPTDECLKYQHIMRHSPINVLVRDHMLVLLIFIDLTCKIHTIIS